MLPLVLAAVLLLAGPAVRLYAALPCNSGLPIACCGPTEGSHAAPAPCHCSLSPAPVSPAVVDSGSPGISPAAIVTAEVVVAPEETTPFRVPSGTPRARAAPLFVLFAAFLN